MLTCITNRHCLCRIFRYVHQNLRQKTTRAERYYSSRLTLYNAASWTQKTEQCSRSSPMNKGSLLVTPSQHLSSSAMLSAAEEDITFETMLSDVNKCRCQSQLLSVKPVRKFTQLDKSRDTEKAAVLVLLYSVDGKPSVLFTERSNQLYMHRGEISFPGGKADQTDQNLSHTALREAEEEIGLCTEKVDIWGEMLPVPGRKFNIAITPIVACYSGELDLASLKLNRLEVESVFASSIEALCLPEHNHYTRFRAREMMTKGTLKKYQQFSKKDTFVLPVYTVNGRRIWGLTAIILHQVLRLIAGGLYTSKIGLLNWHPAEHSDM